jgi:hypothetical protein
VERKPNTVLGLFALSIFIVSLYTFNYTKSLAGEIPDISSLSLLSSNNRSFNSDDIEIDYQTPSQPTAEVIRSTEPLSSPSSLVAPPALIAPNVASSTPSHPQLQYPVPLPMSQSTSMPIASTSATDANHPAIANTSGQNTASSIPLPTSLKMVSPSSLHILSTISQNIAPSSNVIVNATPSSAIPAPSSAVPVSASVPPTSLSTTNTSVQNTASSSSPNLK